MTCIYRQNILIDTAGKSFAVITPMIFRHKLFRAYDDEPNEFKELKITYSQQKKFNSIPLP